MFHMPMSSPMITTMFGLPAADCAGEAAAGFAAAGCGFAACWPPGDCADAHDEAANAASENRTERDSESLDTGRPPSRVRVGHPSPNARDLTAMCERRQLEDTCGGVATWRTQRAVNGVPT